MSVVETELDAAAQWATSYRSVLVEAVKEWVESGRWLTLDELGRAALRRGDEIDVYAALRELPPPLGRVEQTSGEVTFRIRALQISASAELIAHEYVRVLWLAMTRLRSHESEPIVERADLESNLHQSPEMANRVSQLVLGEDWMFHGGSGSADGEWIRHVGEHTRAVATVKSVDDYLSVEGARFWSAPRARVVTFGVMPASVVANGHEALGVSELHPSVAHAAGTLLQQGHFDSAVREAAIVLRETLRAAGREPGLDGASLAGKTLNKEAPGIVLADLTTADGRGEQDGWRMLAQGFIAAIRNPVSHRAVYEDFAEAFEAVALVSLLVRRIQSANAKSLPTPQR